MKILNIETSTNICSAAIGIDGLLKKQLISTAGANHASVLPTFVERLLQDTPQLDAIAISGGPGSYTGLRIGTSIAKGLCYAMHIPLIAIDTTAVIANAILQQNAAQEQEDCIICPMIDARRMEVYAALYDRQLQQISNIEALVIDSQSFADTLQQTKILFGGNGADKCSNTIISDNAIFLRGIEAEAQYMCNLSEQRYLQAVAGVATFEDTAYYTPFYLKDFLAAPSHVKGLHKNPQQ